MTLVSEQQGLLKAEQTGTKIQLRLMLRRAEVR